MHRLADDPALVPTLGGNPPRIKSVEANAAELLRGLRPAARRNVALSRRVFRSARRHARSCPPDDDDPMKILLIVHGFPPECTGGTESYVLALAKELIGARSRGRGRHRIARRRARGPRRALRARGHQGPQDPPERALRRQLGQVATRPRSSRRSIGCSPSFRPDLVHVHHWIRLSRHLVELFHDRGIPAVCTLHDLWTTCPIAFRVRKGSFCELPAGAASCHDCAPHAEAPPTIARTPRRSSSSARTSRTSSRWRAA